MRKDVSKLTPAVLEKWMSGTRRVNAMKIKKFKRMCGRKDSERQDPTSVQLPLSVCTDR